MPATVAAYLIATAVLGSRATAQTTPTPGGEISTIDPPELSFFTKVLYYEGIPIKASAEVDDAALLAARERLSMMLKRIPNSAWNLKSEGVELHIIGKNQVTSDLPENRHLKGRPFEGDFNVDERTRGLGGPLASCGEENLLKLSGDRYHGRDICVHEFAHVLRYFGLDDELSRRIRRRYHRSLSEGLWEDTYAETNYDEFFAELSAWYFGTHGDPGKMSPPPGVGPAWLHRYDPGAFELLDDIYRGRLPARRLELITLPRLDPAKEGGIRSGPPETKTTVRFLNRTGGEVQVFWLDYEGKRQLYGKSINPGGRFFGNTFATHAWLVADMQGRGIALYVSDPKPGVAFVTLHAP